MSFGTLPFHWFGVNQVVPKAPAIRFRSIRSWASTMLNFPRAIMRSQMIVSGGPQAESVYLCTRMWSTNVFPVERDSPQAMS